MNDAQNRGVASHKSGVDTYFEAPSRDAEGVEEAENGEGVPLTNRLGVWGSVMSSPSGVRGRAPAENRFQCFSSVTECLSLRYSS